MDIGMIQQLEYYRQQSVLTDPGAQVTLYNNLPNDIEGLVQIVQGLLIPPYGRVLRWYSINPHEVGQIDNTRFGLRKMIDLLQRIQKRSPAPLSVARPPRDRIGANCRNFAVLLVSMLRHQGIPARERVGFAGYLEPTSPMWWEHRIAEYWDGREERWVFADSMIDDIQKKARKISFSTLDISQQDPFLTAGEVWLQCRKGELNPNQFGDSETDIGMPPIRYALLHDFAALNKYELLGSDDWGELITKPEASLTDDDLRFLDRIATLIVNVDDEFEELRTSFKETPYGQTLQQHIESG